MYNFQAKITGRCQLYSDGILIRDELNAIHPQNMARIFARALANEQNHYINRIAFGNGGTMVDIASNVIYKTPNDGQSPDDATWDSRLYNEIFSKIIDEGSITLNPLLGIDPGSADVNVGIRMGGGSDPSSDPESIPNVSGPGVRSIDRGLTSDVVITVMLNQNEPVDNTKEQTTFVFDEIGLYTTGTQAIPTNGYQQINVGNKTSMDDSKLLPGTAYTFRVAVNDGTPTSITFITPLVGGTGANKQILYGDLCEAINNGSISWGMLGTNPLPGNAIMSITDNTNKLFPSIYGVQTNGYLVISSITTGTSSKILLDSSSWARRETNTFINQLNAPLGSLLLDPINGVSAGIRNTPTTPSSERERLLTHLIITPVIKQPNKALQIIYTLSVSVARTED